MFGQGAEKYLDIKEMTRELKRQAKVVNHGDLTEQEAVLTAQAATMDVIFTRLIGCATANLHENLGTFETFMRLALKAQAQCRHTIETLAAMKHPTPVAFVKQANIGALQVHHGASCAQEFQNAPTKLLEAEDAWLDTGAAREAAASHPALETVDAVHGTSHARGKGKIRP